MVNMACGFLVDRLVMDLYIFNRDPIDGRSVDPNQTIEFGLLALLLSGARRSADH